MGSHLFSRARPSTKLMVQYANPGTNWSEWALLEKKEEQEEFT